MRLVAIAVLALCAAAHAKPTIAVAPIAGDRDGKVAEVIVESVTGDAKLIKPKDVVKTIGKLGIAGELDAKDAQRLQKQLKADAIVQGRVSKAGKEKKLKLTVFAKGKKPESFTIEFKNAKSDKLRDGLREGLAKRLDGLKSDEDEEEERRVAKEKKERDEREARETKEREAKEAREAKEREVKDKKDRAEREAREAERTKAKKVATRDDDTKVTKKAKKKKKSKRAQETNDDSDDSGDDDDDRTPGPMARVDAGTTFGVRRLTYKATNKPPRVGTFGVAASFEGELYPLANKDNALRGLGLAVEYEKTIGLAIQVPNGGPKVPIDQSRYAIGARFRFLAGKPVMTLGVDIGKRRYVADRSVLMLPTDLDAPDVDYLAFVPNVGLGIPVGARATFYTTLGALLVLAAGPIQERTSFGAATVYGAELATGFDIALGKSLRLRLGGEVEQISLKFKGNGAQSAARGVTNATDRTFAGSLTLAMTR